MNSVTVLLIALLLAAIAVVWYLIHRYLRSTSRLDSGTGRAGELEAFIAAYRSGRIDANSLRAATPVSDVVKPEPVPVATLSTPSTTPGAAVVAAAAARSVAAQTLLRPEVKLAYLSLRAGLRDHHVFPNIALSDLTGRNVPGRTDLVVCNSSFAIVAVIDVSIGPGAHEPARAEHLQSAGIRYMRVNAKAMPRPDDLRGLLYPK